MLSWRSRRVQELDLDFQEYLPFYFIKLQKKKLFLEL